MNKNNIMPILIGGVSLVLVLGAVGYFLLNSDSTNSNQPAIPLATDDKIDNSPASDSAVMSDSSGEYSGTVLAGSSSPLLAFEKSDYDKALKSNKLVTLYFYANWCPICREEFPKMQEVFNELDTDKVVGFQVNFNDSETDDHEKALASEFGIAYQHSKVFLKNGERVLKSPESWEKDRYIEEINKFIQ